MASEEMMKGSLQQFQSDPETLISLRVAASMLGLDPSTIRKRLAGTNCLTLIAQGKKLFLILGEVLEYRHRLIEDARQRSQIERLFSND